VCRRAINAHDISENYQDVATGKLQIRSCKKRIQISRNNLYREKLDSLAYISAADSMGLCLLLFTQLFLKVKRSESRTAGEKRILTWVCLHSNLCSGLQKTHVVYNRVRFGRPRSSKVDDFGTNRRRVFLSLPFIFLVFLSFCNTLLYRLFLFSLSYNISNPPVTRNAAIETSRTENLGAKTAKPIENSSRPVVAGVAFAYLIAVTECYHAQMTWSV